MRDRTALIADLQIEISACRRCRDRPDGKTPLPHEPRPVVRLSSTARIVICGQAPGIRVHASGIPFTDPSGDRLRSWLGVSAQEFYDTSRIAIVPMGFCFPGLDAKGGDLPPRRECAKTWHARVFDAMDQIDLFLLVGHHAMRWHLGASCPATMTESVRNWRTLLLRNSAPRTVPLPHPSWRNNHWLTANPWFAEDVLPQLKREVRLRLESPAV